MVFGFASMLATVESTSGGVEKQTLRVPLLQYSSNSQTSLA